MSYAFTHAGHAYTSHGQLPEGIDPEAHNRAVETDELTWLRSGPDRVFLYVHKTGGSRLGWEIRTWRGTVVSDRCQIGPSVPVGGIAGPWARKRSVDCRIAGVRYVGWYYETAGDYCRLRKATRQ